ncbi:hypothetical protein LSCM4_07206 [Leishmania orientalis]|uniref:Uncharacterized protein n=1 Tax=Leishmania orientalis TaxID=2249476 RepID=A0A836HRQ8_9TRYP|nr:hypothetical protein LSCM4_07206 [Leishmania orientalis]
MPSEVEELLAKHQRKFAAHEEFLLSNTTTPSPNPQRRRQWVGPNATVLSIHHNGARDAYGLSGVSDDDRKEVRIERSYSRDRHASPAAHAPTAAMTSVASAAAVARAIATYGDLLGPAYYATGLHTGAPPPLQRRSTSRSMRDTHTASAAASASHPRTSTSGLDDIDYLIGERLRMAGRYHLGSTPDAIYIKSQAWALRRDQVNDALRREQEDAKLRECTFSPNLRHVTMKGTSEVSVMCNGGSSHSPTAPAAAEASVTEDPGVLQHFARLEEARRRRRESAARLNGRKAHRWTGQPTVPHEFQLGLRVAEPILSLRKPYMPNAGGGGGGRTASSPDRDTREEFVARASAARRAVQKQCSFSCLPPSNDGDRLGGRTPAPVPAAVDAAKSLLNAQQERVRGQERELDAQQPLASSTTLIPETADSESPTAEPQRLFVDVDTQDLACGLTEQLAHRDPLVQTQVEDLVRLSRELDVVIETLHQISPLGTSQ